MSRNVTRLFRLAIAVSGASLFLQVITSPALHAAAQCDCITQRVEIGTKWSCVDPPHCASDYEAFPQRASKFRKPVSTFQLWGQLLGLLTDRVPLVTSADLESELPRALNIQFLVDGLDSRSLTVTTIRDDVCRETGKGYRERELLFSDPYIGTFKGILLTPLQAKRYPVVLALHGHAQTAESYRDLYFAREYPKRGVGILMITFRAMDPWRGEHSVSVDLLRNGFDLMGLRVYEALVSSRFLGCSSEVQAGKVGLIGHSGGSSTGNLLVRITPERVAAYVSDLQINYSALGAPEPYHCETIPKVYPYHVLINNFETLPRSVSFLSVPYEYTGHVQQILGFFVRHLGPANKMNSTKQDE